MFSYDSLSRSQGSLTLFTSEKPDVVENVGSKVLLTQRPHCDYPEYSLGKHEDQCSGYTNYHRWCFKFIFYLLKISFMYAFIKYLFSITREEHFFCSFVNLSGLLDMLNSSQSPFFLGTIVLMGADVPLCFSR